MGKLTARKAESLRVPGMYCDGGGLYLRVGPSGGKSWILRTMVYGKRRDFGLGSASLVSLAEARDSARELRKVARAGGDPDTIRRRETLTFKEAAKRVHKNLLPTWSSQRHGEIWLASLERNVFPHLGERPIDSLGAADVLRVLEPIWSVKPDTANRVKQRISTVFDWAKGAGHFPHENPVNGLTRALPNIKRQTEHMASLPWKDLPEFMVQLSEREGISASALQFIILTAVRSGEARGARWVEIEGNTWIIPAERMKGKRTHRVPLSPEAMHVLNKVRGLDAELVFPSASLHRAGSSRKMSDNVFRALMKRMDCDGLTTHGFRSTFRDWASESALASREVAEAALAHVVGSKVEQAYARSDLFERRRKLMDAWGRYATGVSGDVHSIVRA